MTFIARRVLCALAAAFFCMPWQSGWAQPYPSKVVRIVVPFGAGGPAEIYTRILGQRLHETLGQSFILDDRPRAGPVTGTEILADAPADGYTLHMKSHN